MIHEDTRIQQSSLDGLGLTGSNSGGGGAAALAGDRMEVNVVRVLVTGRVGDGEPEHITDTSADHRTRCAHRHRIVSVDPVTPRLVLDAVWRNGAHSFDDLEVHLHDRLTRSARRRRYRRCIGHVDLRCRRQRKLCLRCERRDHVGGQGRIYFRGRGLRSAGGDGASRSDLGEQLVDLLGDDGVVDRVATGGDEQCTGCDRPGEQRSRECDDGQAAKGEMWMWGWVLRFSSRRGPICYLGHDLLMPSDPARIAGPPVACVDAHKLSPRRTAA